MAEIQTDIMGVKIQNQQDGHLIGDCTLKETWCHLEEVLVSHESLKKQNHSQISAVPTQTVSREEGVSQIILITWSCCSLPICGDSWSSSESAVIIHLTRLPQDTLLIWLPMSLVHRRRTAWPGDQKKLLSSPHIPGGSKSYFKPLYSLHTCHTQVTMCLYFFQFSEKVVWNKFILLTLLYFTIKYEKFYQEV